MVLADVAEVASSSTEYKQGKIIRRPLLARSRLMLFENGHGEARFWSLFWTKWEGFIIDILSGLAVFQFPVQDSKTLALLQ
mmetsp:Transcript_6777/g.10309  ORF Transcript_6777/g.10309 Transcript_6777/m.10309 type:complete len:81 (+) Transcript_6777:1094-1336(+)